MPSYIASVQVPLGIANKLGQTLLVGTNPVGPPGPYPPEGPAPCKSALKVAAYGLVPALKPTVPFELITVFVNPVVVPLPPVAERW